MAEETRKPKKAVPRALFWSIFCSGIMALVTLITLIVSLSRICCGIEHQSP